MRWYYLTLLTLWVDNAMSIPLLGPRQTTTPRTPEEVYISDIDGYCFTVGFYTSIDPACDGDRALDIYNGGYVYGISSPRPQLAWIVYANCLSNCESNSGCCASSLCCELL